MRITLDLGSPVLLDSELFAQTARIAIEAAILVCRAHLRRFKTPPLYSTGIRYRLEPLGVEEFVDVERILQRGFADCAQLVAWRVAELRESGERAEIRIQWHPPRADGKRFFHVVVRRENGRIEDPSVRLGMRSGDALPYDKHPVIGYRRRFR